MFTEEIILKIETRFMLEMQIGGKWCSSEIYIFILLKHQFYK
jgi:hypothetical protein